MRRAGILLDRDGTIVVDDGYVGAIERVRFIDGAPEAISSFNQAGIPVAIITNQSGVARGYYTVEDVERVHRYIADRLAAHGAHIDLVLFCPYHPDGTVPRYARRSFDRKPEPGMALAAADALGLDLARSWVVGDSHSDMAVASAVGASGILLGPESVQDPSIRSFPDLVTAARYILGQSGPPDQVQE